MGNLIIVPWTILLIICLLLIVDALCEEEYPLKVVPVDKRFHENFQTMEINRKLSKAQELIGIIEDPETNNNKYFEKMFTFEVKEDKVTITGLTDEGNNQTSIYIPSTYNGKEVAGIGTQIFDNENCKVESVILRED